MCGHDGGAQWGLEENNKNMKIEEINMSYFFLNGGKTPASASIDAHNHFIA
jgi:hypothetical protein